MSLLDNLNPMQKEAVLQTDGPLLLLAGAGSGKTNVLTKRIAHLVELGLDPFNILAITFTNKAAKEMKTRVAKLINRADAVWISTFHSSCVRILRRHIENIGYSRSFSIYDTDDSEKLMKEVIKSENLNEKNFPAKSVLHAISSAKDELTPPAELLKRAGADYRLSVIARLYAHYQKRLKENNALDFDDIIYKTVELFILNQSVLAEYQNRFLYIMVDEYQDTNTAQYQLVRLLASKNKNLCVVGDDDQSIYGWRGANIKNILDFEKDYPDARVIKLEQNYRSTGTILNTANKVIQNNQNRKSKRLWTEKEQGQPVRFIKAPNDIEEASFIVTEIKKSNETGKPFSDFAVLYRTNAQSRLIEDQLVKENIPYRLIGGVRFYERREIKDVLAYLRCIVNPFDDIALKRIINVPRRGIGETTIERVIAYSVVNDVSFYGALKSINEYSDSNSKKTAVLGFVELLEELVAASEKMSVSEFINYMLEKTGYINSFFTANAEEAAERYENIQELVSKAAQFESESEDVSLSAFLEDVALVADIDNLKENNDSVVLMTIHSSKGLEFPTVFISGMEENVFPSYRSLTSGSAHELEEERRLCYVAITRAQEELYVTCSAQRMTFGNIISNPISRFVKEMPPESLDGLAPKITAASLEPESRRRFANADLRDTVKNVRLKNEAKTYLDTSIPAPKGISIDFDVGDKVRQMKYGVGIVSNIKSAGADYEVTVNFPGLGEKKFMAHLSKLTKEQ